MVEVVTLGEITCPSGELVLLDGGHLGVWCGDGAPEEIDDPQIPPSADLEVVGRDAEAAARSFDRQPGRRLYDIPLNAGAEFTALFDGHCREHGYDASLRRLPGQVPHRERIRRAIAGAEPYVMVCGLPVVPVGGLPTDRRLRVEAAESGDGDWTWMRIVLGDAPVAAIRELGHIGVDWARLAFADADALSSWRHEESIDGLADTVFWGRDEEEVAAEFGATRTGTPGDDNFGWLNLPVAEALEKARALQARREAEPERRFAFDFRPHSHHWRVMAGVRASEYDAATIDVGGATILFAMTSVGDGYFPVHVDVDGGGDPVAIRVTIRSEED
jgi:hypothetical protein